MLCNIVVYSSFVCCFIGCPSPLSPFRSSALCVRVMLYQIYEDTTEENLEKMKFLLSSKLGKRQMETSAVRTHPPTLPHPHLYKKQ